MIDLDKIIMFGDFTLWEFMGLMTIILSVINIILYIVIAFMVWNTKHKITIALKNKLIVESLLAGTTVLMGIGAIAHMPISYWQISYTFRVALLMVTPFVLWKLAKACIEIVSASKEFLEDENR